MKDEIGLREALLPCPFCGSVNIDAAGWASLTAKGPACDDCGASAGSVSDDHAANIAAWNNRARPVEVEAVLIAAKYALEAINTGRSEPLFIARDALRNALDDLASARSGMLSAEGGPTP